MHQKLFFFYIPDFLTRTALAPGGKNIHFFIPTMFADQLKKLKIGHVGATIVRFLILVLLKLIEELRVKSNVYQQSM